MSINRTLDIVIVNWNSGEQLKDCLRTLTQTGMHGVSLEKVVVVDNNSSDGSSDGLETLNLPMVVLQNRRNDGFARGCNQGAKAGSAEFLLFLNPDVRVFHNSLSVPINFFNSEDGQNTGIAGIQLVDESGEISRSCARFPDPLQLPFQMAGLDRIFPGRFPGHFLSQWDHGENRRVDQVMGAFFMVRRSLFERLGGFDERFFVYFEDLDFSLRAKKIGYSSWYLADAAVYHRGCGTSDSVKKERLFYYLKSRILYGFKHFGRKQGILLMLGTLLFEPVARMMLALSRFKGREFSDTIKGFHMLFKNLMDNQTAGKGVPR